MSHGGFTDDEGEYSEEEHNESQLEDQDFVEEENKEDRYEIDENEEEQDEETAFVKKFNGLLGLSHSLLIHDYNKRYLDLQRELVNFRLIKYKFDNDDDLLQRINYDISEYFSNAENEINSNIQFFKCFQIFNYSSLGI